VSLAVQDRVDRGLLDLLQAGVPLVARPFAEIGQSPGISEAEVLERVCALKQAGLIRQISAIFDTRRLGYQSTLVAFHVSEQDLEQAAGQVSAHASVSHNYARPCLRARIWRTRSSSWPRGQA
jgi:DNA-binding Lrp family transcriptional regulator